MAARNLLLLLCLGDTAAHVLRHALPTVSSPVAIAPILRHRTLAPAACAAGVLATTDDETSTWKSSARASLPVAVRYAQLGDAVELAEMCTNVFFGTHSFADGPVIFWQRSQIRARVIAQLSRRLHLDGEARECQLLVAVDRTSGRICGCVDLAIHLYNEVEQRFELTRDEMPLEGLYSWTPYVASLAVASPFRRRGVARQLMGEAERLAREWGYRQVMLEVAHGNDAALSFYRRRGYKMVRADAAGSGATQVRVRAFWWDITSVQKFVMRRSLGPL